MCYHHRCALLLLTSTLLFACKKSVFLDAKPDQGLVVPHSLGDCQAILDNDISMNGYGFAGFPSLLENGSDDFYTTDSLYNGYLPTDQHVVTWAKDIYAGNDVSDWNLPYRTVFYANEVLELLKVLYPAPGDLTTWKRERGSALFYRAFAFYELAQVFSKVYDSTTAKTDPGIPVRMTTGVDERIVRASVQATYDTIIAGLREALTLLPPDASDYPTRPCKAAAYGLLARTWLCAGDYSHALLYADSCLQIRHGLMDYNMINQNAGLPFKRTNTEVIFAAAMAVSGPAALKKSFTDSVLFNSYAADDIRKKIFFKFGSCFFGKYDERGYGFCGIATDEIFLTRAECFARTGDLTNAMSDLNALLGMRWTSGKFVPHTAPDLDSALEEILLERRKELLFRGLRWTDLRRLNKDNRWAITLKRSVNQTTYTLPPNDPRYVYAIPADVISANPGMIQNLR